MVPILSILLSIIYINFVFSRGFLTNAINGALKEIGTAPSDSNYSYEFIIKETFGTLSYPLEPPLCSTDYPEVSDSEVEFQKLQTDKFIIFGTSSITRPPKYYNCTENDEENMYVNCMGFEAFLAQIICDRIALHYNLGYIQAKFYLTKWTSIVDDLYNHKYEVILSGMGVKGTWIYDGEELSRDKVLDFSCPYQLSESALVHGIKPLPSDIGLIGDNYGLLNRSDVSISADSGTGMEDWIINHLPLATYRPCGGNFSTSSSDCRKWVIEGEVHIYVAPILNALYDDELMDELVILYKFKDGDKPISMGLRIVVDGVGFEICYTVVILIMIIILS